MTELSIKSNRFLEDLRLYLFSSGKKEREINEIVEELRDHLIEAEADGKPIEAIIGRSPKQYMEQLNAELSPDIKSWAKYVPLIAVGALSFTVAGDLLEGTLQYSLWFIFGTLSVTLFFLLSVFGAFRFTASRQLSRTKEFLVLVLPISINMVLIGGVLLGDYVITTPVIRFGVTGSIIIAIVLGAFLIGFSVWSKTMVLPVVIAALHIPTYLLSFTGLAESPRLIYGMLIGYALIVVFMVMEFKRLKRKESTKRS